MIDVILSVKDLNGFFTVLFDQEKFNFYKMNILQKLLQNCGENFE